MRGIKRKGSPRKDFGIPQRPAETGGGKRKVTSAEEDKGAEKRKGSPSKRWETLEEAATYSPTYECSTIGADRFNFSVRNGKRWDPVAIAT